MSALVLWRLRTKTSKQIDDDVTANGTRTKLDPEMLDVGLGVENERMGSTGGWCLIGELGLRGYGVQDSTYLRAVSRRSRGNTILSLVDGVAAYGEHAERKKKKGGFHGGCSGGLTPPSSATEAGLARRDYGKTPDGQPLFAGARG